MRVGGCAPSPLGETCGAVCVCGTVVGGEAGALPNGSRTGVGCAGLIAPEKADSEATDNMADILRWKA
jgi:hypothetical protein